MGFCGVGLGLGGGLLEVGLALGGGGGGKFLGLPETGRFRLAGGLVGPDSQRDLLWEDEEEGLLGVPLG